MKHHKALLIVFHLYFTNCQFHLENVALSGTCTMTEQHGDSGDCKKAIDNVTDLTFRSTQNGENCIHTTIKTVVGCFPFWQVILKEDYTMTNLTIYNRDGYLQRLTYTDVTVNGTLCKSFGSDRSTIQNVNTFQCSSPIRGRIVNISRHYPNCSKDGDFSLNLCEVQVWVCSKGWYGNDCNTPCKDHCSNNATCDRHDGSCPQGCITGWYGSQCDYRCPQNCLGACNRSSGACFACTYKYYGHNCTDTCGHCAKQRHCDLINGYCQECEPGWVPPLCQLDAGQSNSAIGAIVGSVVGIAVVISAVTTFILVYRRRRITHKGTSNSRLDSQNILQNTNNILFAESDMQGVVANEDLRAHSLITIVNPRGIAVDGKDTTNQMYENVTVIKKTDRLGDVTTSLAVMQEDLKNPNDVYDDDTDDVYNIESIYLTYKPLVVWDAFQQSILSSLASGQLGAHFKSLVKGLQYPHAEGRKPENIRKNRFKAILPYDANRVILQRSKAEKDSDYINASYIKGYLKEKAYIATQGPQAHTVNDFWLMICQRKTAQIVMLTNLKENGKDKCEEYWPAPGTSLVYGNTVVTCLSEDLMADFIARLFSLKSKWSTLEHQVQHYHYLAWPDHGVPSATSLVDFWRYVRARDLQLSLPVVHCSAGVGRTGTYIALDIAMDLVADGRDVNVLKIVTDLREDRTDMVQAEAQYKFLYEAIFEAYTSRNCRLTSEEFDKGFPQPIIFTNINVVMDNEFKILQLMGEFMPKQESGMSTKNENIIKCRNKSALPGDSHLVSLKGHNQRNTYINAVRISSFKQRNGILLTQLPLPETLFDFWSLVDEFDVTTIVSLSYKDESKVVQNYCQYWPTSCEEVLNVDRYDIKQVTSTVLGHQLTSYTVTFQKENNIRTVYVLHFTNWAGEVPEDPNDVIQLLETLNTYRSQRGTSPILVQCIDGVVKSGLFCVMSEIFDRMTYDHVIDVFLSARHVQAVRPQAITKELQYRFCYKFAQAAKQQRMYENS